MKNILLFLILLLVPVSSLFAQKKPVKFVTPVPVSETDTVEKEGLVILMAPLSPTGSFSFNRKNISTGKISKVNVNYHIYGKDTTDYWFWNDLTLDLKSSLEVPYKLVITGYSNTNRIYPVPMTVKSGIYHFDLTLLTEKAYKLLVYDDRGHELYSFSWEKRQPNVGSGESGW